MKENEKTPKFKDNAPVKYMSVMRSYPSHVIQEIKQLDEKNIGDLISFYILILDHRLSEHVSKLDIFEAAEILNTSPRRIRAARLTLIKHEIISNESLYCSDKVLRHFLIVKKK